MINERMLEFLSLAEIINNWELMRFAGIVTNVKDYNWEKVHKRYQELAEELLSPYVINKDSKE